LSLQLVPQRPLVAVVLLPCSFVDNDRSKEEAYDEQLDMVDRKMSLIFLDFIDVWLSVLARCQNRWYLNYGANKDTQNLPPTPPLQHNLIIMLLSPPHWW